MPAKNGDGLSGMRVALISAMSFPLALLVLTCGAMAAIVQQLRRAPEGFEDETGFHFSSPTDNQSREKSDGLDVGAGVRPALFQTRSNASRRRETPDSIGIAIRRVREAH